MQASIYLAEVYSSSFHEPTRVITIQLSEKHRLLRRRVCQLETPAPSYFRASASRRPLIAVVRLVELGEVGVASSMRAGAVTR